MERSAAKAKNPESVPFGQTHNHELALVMKTIVLTLQLIKSETVETTHK